MSTTDDVFDAGAKLDIAPIPYPRLWLTNQGIFRQRSEGAAVEVQLEDDSWEDWNA